MKIKEIIFKKKKVEISLFHLLKWGYIQFLANFMILTVIGICCYVTISVEWDSSNRYLILLVSLGLFLSFLLGTIASGFVYYSIRKNSKPSTFWLCLSLFFVIFGWSLPLTWFFLKPKIIVTNFDVVGRNLIELQKHREDRPIL